MKTNRKESDSKYELKRKHIPRISGTYVSEGVKLLMGNLMHLGFTKKHVIERGVRMFEAKVTSLINEIAKKTYYEIKEFAESRLADNSYPSWEELDHRHQLTFMLGVINYLHDPDLKVEKAHHNYVSRMFSEGWIYGEVKDVVKKTHPALIKYDELSYEYQLKDQIFKVSVLKYKDILTNFINEATF